MTVKELIEQLSLFPMDKKVTISDGYLCHFYDGEYSVELFEGTVDIGIGGTNEQ